MSLDCFCSVVGLLLPLTMSFVGPSRGLGGFVCHSVTALCHSATALCQSVTFLCNGLAGAAIFLGGLPPYIIKKASEKVRFF